MRVGASSWRGWWVGLVCVAGMAAGSCGGGDVVGPDRAPQAVAPTAPGSADSGSVTADGADKSEVCHLDKTLRTYTLLALAPNALATHLAHGDLKVATRYADADGDGYGFGAPFKCPATTSTRFATQAGDCNDSAGTIHPGASELANGTDDDCDGQVDEGLCSCSSFSASANWVDAVVDSYRSQYTATGAVCGSSPFADGLEPSFTVHFSGQNLDVMIFPGTGTETQCGYVAALGADFSLRLQGTGAGGQACQALIVSSRAYQDLCAGH